MKSRIYVSIASLIVFALTTQAFGRPVLVIDATVNPASMQIHVGDTGNAFPDCAGLDICQFGGGMFPGATRTQAEIDGIQAGVPVTGGFSTSARFEITLGGLGGGALGSLAVDASESSRLVYRAQPNGGGTCIGNDDSPTCENGSPTPNMSLPGVYSESITLVAAPNGGNTDTDGIGYPNGSIIDLTNPVGATPGSGLRYTLPSFPLNEGLFHRFDLSGELVGGSQDSQLVSGGDAAMPVIFVTGVVPEPSCLVLLVMGVLGLTLSARRSS